jgi:chitodextrinase
VLFLGVLERWRAVPPNHLPSLNLSRANSENPLRLLRRFPALRASSVASIFALAVVVALQGCSASSYSSSNQDPPIAVVVAPTSASVAVTKTQPFTASVSGTTNMAVNWQVNGVAGGDSTHGTISASGLYVAPAAVPTPQTVTVAAISQADATKSASATVTVAAASSDITVPSAPANLAGTATSSTQINLNWTASTDNIGVTGYRIERCTGSSCTNFAQLATSSSPTFSNTGLLPGTTYGYRVRAADAAGNLSNYSNTVAITTLTGADTTPPSAPSGLVATASSTTQIGLTWTASTDNIAVTGYRIERCSGSSCTSFAQIATTTGATTFANSGLTASTAYRYRVRATDAAGNLSAYSNIASATTPAVSDTTLPSAPSNLVATASSSSQIGLTWTASTDNVGVTGYRVERCSGASCSSFAQVGTTTGATTFANSGLTASTSYSYRVRATDAAGNLSNYSNVASATTSSSGGSSITISVSPKRGGLTTSQTLAITATLTNDTANQGVTWSFSSTGSTSGGGFSSASSTSGIAVTFTAPSGAGMVTVTATAVGDNSKTAAAAIGVTDLAGVLTYHNNLSRDGANQREYALTTSNVATATFGKLFSCAVDGAIYAQPLWIPKVSIGGGTHNVILVATMHDSVYVFDADASTCVKYWNKQYLASGETWGDHNDLGSSDIFKDIGILGTPVIDSAANTVYFVSKSKTTSSGNYQQRLHAVSLTDGSERSNSPAAVDSSITMPGTCEGGSTIAFNALRENQRPGLALVNGTVYVSWASHGDVDPYHGWVIGFNPTTLARTAVWNASPNQQSGVSYCRGGIWMSGGAPAADSSHNVYVMTGNGVFDANSGGSNYSDSYLKLSGGLAVSDWFTPHDQSNLDSNDTDVGSGGTALLIDQTSGPIAHLMVGAGKSGVFYVLNRDSMGHFTSNDAGAVQTWTSSGHSFSTPAFWNNSMFYFGVIFGSVKSGEQYTFTPSTGQFTTTPAFTTPTGFGFPGATPSVSSSGTSNGIVWAIDNSGFGSENGGARSATAAILHAYSATNLGTELWNSTQGSGNTAGFAVKFNVPTVANGKVYVGTRGNDDTKGSGTTLGELDVYGLLPN